MNEKCDNCLWWRKNSPQSVRRGRCHFMPPSPMSFNCSVVWPETDKDDFCGSWKGRYAPPNDD